MNFPGVFSEYSTGFSRVFQGFPPEFPEVSEEEFLNITVSIEYANL